jgi:hypothetical protein
MRASVSGIFFSLALCAAVNATWITSAAAKPHVADTVADFSTVQGYKHWRYGYVRPASGGTKFYRLVQTGQSDDSWTHLQPDKYWTRIWATGQHPNGTNGNQGRKKVEEWAIRRWISPWAGTALINGTVGGDGGGGGQVVASVVVDGVTYFTSSQSDTTAVPFSFNVTIAKGSVVDFVLAPFDHFDVNDVTPYAAKITVN